MGLVFVHSIPQAIKSYGIVALTSGTIGFCAGYYVHRKLQNRSVQVTTQKIHNSPERKIISQQLEERVQTYFSEGLQPDETFIMEWRLSKEQKVDNSSDDVPPNKRQYISP